MPEGKIHFIHFLITMSTNVLILNYIIFKYTHYINIKLIRCQEKGYISEGIKCNDYPHNIK